MRREIAETADRLREQAQTWAAGAAAARAMPMTRPGVLGRGSSDNAADFFVYAATVVSGRPVIEARPWAVLAAPDIDGWSDTTIVAFSASGRSADVLAAARRLAAVGARIVSVVNANGADTPLAALASVAIDLGVGAERAVPATKSFVAQLAVAGLLADLFGARDVVDAADALDPIDPASVARVAKFIADARRVIWLGRGLTHSAARDSALKLEEAGRVPASAWSAAEVLHGPVTAIGQQDRVVLLVDRSESSASLVDAAAALSSRGVPWIAVGADLNAAGGERVDLQFAPSPNTDALVLAAFFQRVALNVAELRGLDPDAPPGLSKVTHTR